MRPDLVAFHEGGGAPQRRAERVLRAYKNRWLLLRKHGKLRRPGLVRLLVRGRLALEVLALRLLGPLLVRDPVTRRDTLAGRRRLLAHVSSEFR